MKSAKNIQLTSYQKLNLNKITNDFNRRLNSSPTSVEVIKGIASKYVVCEGYGTRIVYSVTSHLNIKSSKVYKI
ncbi:unnamed protein product [marine sediment metagenome]|uniref:Uncharacterized protein n=1 Tax=marine sediment metagenome TaxID=412755 RepID=X0S479_9ZZZZ